MTEREQLTSTAGMSPDEIVKATAEGRLNDYLRRTTKKPKAEKLTPEQIERFVSGEGEGDGGSS